MFKRHDDLIDAAERLGPHNFLSPDKIQDLLPTLPLWPDAAAGTRSLRHAGTGAVLAWLATYPGDGWQQRWLSTGVETEASTAWFDTVNPADTRSRVTMRSELSSGLTTLILCRVLLPSYRFLAVFRPPGMCEELLRTARPDVLAGLDERATKLRMAEQHVREGRATIAKISIHTGHAPELLTANEVLAYRAAVRTRSGQSRGAHAAWDLLRGVADLGDHDTLRDAIRLGQRSMADLVDAYDVRCRPIRDLLVRYLDERRTAQDYSSVTNLAVRLVRNFWTDLEQHHPGIDSLHLTPEIAEAWKQRLRVVTRNDGTTRPRKAYFEILQQVRSFYLDIQEWAQDDPAWVPWAVPSPIRRGETDGIVKIRKATTAKMHQRVRDRLPSLPTLVDIAEQQRTDYAALLQAALSTEPGETFNHSAQRYRRALGKPHRPSTRRDHHSATVFVANLETEERIDLARAEDEAFWSWAIVETLRHTGVRVEELLEITHLALVSYQLPDTGEIVPMLQIVPSKSNEERLLLVSPELASVLATIITRLRHHNGGTVPLTSRYDAYERLVGGALPHLFQRKVGWRWQVPSHRTVQELLNQLLATAGLQDTAGEPLRFTPHDFRRLFATDAISGGLPVHILARLLGHANINTTQAYIAVFDEDLVRSYRAFVDQRRTERPQAEYREPTEQEWGEFQQHFYTRKLELGECGRPYGTPCKHEHACIRCPSLRLDPRARPRLAEIIANLRDRIREARLNGWLGEVQGLEASLNEATRKLVTLDRTLTRDPERPVNLGMPVITDVRSSS